MRAAHVNSEKKVFIYEKLHSSSFSEKYSNVCLLVWLVSSIINALTQILTQNRSIFSSKVTANEMLKHNYSTKETYLDSTSNFQILSRPKIEHIDNFDCTKTRLILLYT